MKYFLTALITVTSEIAAISLPESVTYTTKLLVELCRHGARAAGTIYPLTVNDPFDNFQEPQVLTLFGAQ